MSGRSWFESAGSHQDLKNWSLLQSGQALGIMTVAGKLSNANAIFLGVRSCCLLPSHRNNFVEDQVRVVEKWAISSTPKTNLCPGDRRRHLLLCVQCSQWRCVRTFRRCSRVFAVLTRQQGSCMYDQTRSKAVQRCKKIVL